MFFKFKKAMKKIFLTGVSGFVGKSIFKKLSKHNKIVSSLGYKKFFDTMPRLKSVVEVINPKTNVKSNVTFTGLADFFG